MNLLAARSVTTLDTIHPMDALQFLRALPAGFVHCVVTSPPYYGLRDYGAAGQIGLEETPERYIARLVSIFAEVRRVLREDGTLWLNLGDTYAGGGRGGNPSESPHKKQATNAGSLAPGQPVPAGLKPKDLVGIPWRVALALQADGWWLRSDIIWHKPNPMPESVTDRPTGAHEYVFLLAKSERYYYDAEAIREPARDWGTRDRHHLRGGTADPLLKHHGLKNCDFADLGRNRRTVWTIATESKPFQHFAMFPRKLVEPMILAGCPAQVCAECGAPYERIVERAPMEIRRTDWGEKAGNRTATSGTMIKPPTSRTVGFAPTCHCDAPISPGIVIDPFMGSGTVALVARRLGRHFIGCDINAEYVALANKRLRYGGDDKRMIAEQRAGVEQQALFEAV